MSYLIDTHVLVWYLDGNSRLPAKIVRLINNPDNDIVVSVASIWELAINLSRKKIKLEIKITFDEIVAEVVQRDFTMMPISFKHLKVLKELPHHHGDPFDRMLISQSIAENISLISVDRQFTAYPVNIIW